MVVKIVEANVDDGLISLSHDSRTSKVDADIGHLVLTLQHTNMFRRIYSFKIFWDLLLTLGAFLILILILTLRDKLTQKHDRMLREETQRKEFHKTAPGKVQMLSSISEHYPLGSTNESKRVEIKDPNLKILQTNSKSTPMRNLTTNNTGEHKIVKKENPIGTIIPLKGASPLSRTNLTPNTSSVKQQGHIQASTSQGTLPLSGNKERTGAGLQTASNVSTKVSGVVAPVKVTQAANGIDPSLKDTGLDFPFLQMQPDQVYRSLLNVTHPTYLKDYLNPCWREPLPSRDPYGSSYYFTDIFRYPRFHDVLVEMKKTWEKKLQDGIKSKLRCLPYYYIVGFAKCGTSDLYEAMAVHPHVIKASSKEFHYWAKARIRDGKTRTFGYVPIRNYIDLFDNVADHMEIYKYPRVNDTDFHPLIVGDASPSTLDFYGQWFWLPEHALTRRTLGPKYTPGHYIRQITPGAHIVIVIRNPVDRLYSDYCYFYKKTSPQLFHSYVTQGLPKMDACMKTRTIWSCVTDKNLTLSIKGFTLANSIYHPFIARWLEVFPKEQIHILRFEDYIIDRAGTVDKLMQDMGLGPFGEDIKKKVYNMGVGNSNFHKEPMLQKTREILQHYFKPHNEKLEQLLGSAKYGYHEG